MKKQLLTFFSLCICLIASAQPFRFIVAADGSGTDLTLQSAIDKCPDNERSIIFVKNGTYYGQTSIGSKATSSSQLISIIGEDRDQVIFTYDKSLPMVTKFEEATTFQIYASDFYAENITFANSAGNTGQALALYTAGDRQTFQNCKILGYQDTYRSKKGTRGYFKNCWIEGAVDFIYAGGVEFFDDCTINCVKGGGYITAPEDATTTIPKSLTVCQKFLRVGFFFRNCDITANSDVPANSYYLGRPWNTFAGTFYLNCTLGSHIKAEGWKDWSGNETSSSFAEYNSMDVNGNPVDTTKRVSWSFQLPKADVDNLLTPTAIYARVNSTTLYDPITFCTRPNPPSNFRLEAGKLVWDAVPDAAGYMIFKDDKYFASTQENSFTVTDEVVGQSVYSYYTVSTNGVLSEGNMPITSLKNIQESTVIVNIQNSVLTFSESVQFSMYNLKGEKVKHSEQFCTNYSLEGTSKGIYLLEIKDQNLKSKIQKINVY